MAPRLTRFGVVLLALVAALAALALGAWLYVANGGLFNPSNAKSEKSACALPTLDSRYPGMVWVPAGEFDFGDSVYPEEGPVRRTQVSGFWIGRTEVTNREFAAFVNAAAYVTVAERPVDGQLQKQLPAVMQQPGAVVFVMPKDQASGQADGASSTPWWRYTPGANWRHPGGPQTGIADKGDFPVVAVTYADAQAYARWRGHVLPTEAQWEWAARAGAAQVAAHGQPLDANTWQGLFPLVNSGQDGFIGLAPVGCFAPNAYGLYDMIGNVWELTQDVFRPSHDISHEIPHPTAQEALAARPKPEQVPSASPGLDGRQRVIKGGSYLCAPNYCLRYRAGARQGQDEDLAVGHLGFRTVLNVPKE